MSKPLRAEPEALEELQAAARWYEQRRDGLGFELLASVREATGRIRESPSSGSPVRHVAPELGIRQLLLGRFPYAVVFIELAEELRILAFAHTSREPGYWRSRIS